MSHTEFIVKLTGYEFALVRDFAELNGKGTGSIAQASAWLVTMQHFALGVEVLETRYHPKQRNVVGWQIEVDFSQGPPVISDSSS